MKLVERHRKILIMHQDDKIGRPHKLSHRCCVMGKKNYGVALGGGD